MRQKGLFKNISRTTAKIWCFSRTNPEPKKFKNNSRNSKTSGHPEDGENYLE